MSEIHFNLNKIFPNANHTILLYADDVIIITATTTDGQILKKLVQRERVQIGLTLNRSKEVVKQFDVHGQDNSAVE